MSELRVPKLLKWPFIVGDLLLVAAACTIYTSKKPVGSVELGLVVLCIALGAVLSILPFVLEYRAVIKLAEAGAMTTVMAQLGQLETIAAQIGSATANWTGIQGEAEKTASAAKAISDRMAAELKSFTEFMQRANDSERSALRLEAEKARRAENDWLQVLVRILDHVHALHAAGVQTGQANLIEQLTNFQNACRDAARRVGLTPFAAAPAEPFDPKRHQVVEGNEAPPQGAAISHGIATGYTFQGRILRPALVRIATDSVVKTEGAAESPK